MKQALSARYGGLLVDAHECDYSSFKHLHLLCPNCKKSVFLVGEKQVPAHTRKIKKDGEEKIVQVKGSEVGSYFAHHPDVSASAVEACELRVRSMSESEKQSIKLKSRNQLLKTLQSHFWKILSSGNAMRGDDLDQRSTLLDLLWANTRVQSKLALDRMYQVYLDLLIESIKNARTAWESQIEDCLKFFFDSPDGKHRQWVSYFANLRHGLDRKMHSLIVFEMMCFLSSPRQRPLIQTLAKDAFLELVELEAARIEFKQPASFIRENPQMILLWRKDPASYTSAITGALKEFMRFSPEKIRDLGFEISFYIIQGLCSIDWAGQYEKYHNEDLAKGKAIA